MAVLAAEGVTGVYESTERPLVQVIKDMEREGVLVDRAVLSRLSGEFAQKMAGMEDEIYALAGEKFNIASPKQLGDILFDKMGLSGGKKTKPAPGVLVPMYWKGWPRAATRWPPPC